MLRALVLWMLCGAADAAIIRGIVVEHLTGRPLARTLVVADPVGGGAGGAKSARTDLSGGFVFEGLPGGVFVVSAARKGFAPMQYGQKQWKSAGLPVILEESQAAQIEIRMRRMGSITGHIMDENDVGLPDHEVVAYRDTKPPTLVNRVASDERGVYRIPSLEPGRYLVRTVARTFEEGGYVPTFFRDVFPVEQARVVDVSLDEETPDITIHPAPGRLFKLAGTAVVPRMGAGQAPVTLTLVSDMGKENVTADDRGHFQFNPQSPGRYELNLASTYGRDPYGGYLQIDLDRDQTDLRISGNLYPQVRVILQDIRGANVDWRALQVIARRKELAGPGARQKIDLSNSIVALPPGRWEFALSPNAAWYPSEFLSQGQPTGERAEGWNEAMVASGGATINLKFTLTSSPGAVHGAVTLSSQIAAGAMVFLEPIDLDPVRRINEVQAVRTDTQGRYQFTGLTPGRYRLLGTFEYQSPTSTDMDAAHAIAVKIEEGRDLQQDLDLFVAR